jgi:hypothetical protein
LLIKLLRCLGAPQNLVIEYVGNLVIENQDQTDPRLDWIVESDALILNQGTPAVTVSAGKTRSAAAGDCKENLHG